jgi:hypothetical protein
MKHINEAVQKTVNQFWNRRNDLVLEASLARVLKHMAGGAIQADPERRSIATAGHFAILTSWRKFGDRKRSQPVLARDQALKGTQTPLGANRANFKALVADIRAQHLGAIRLTGSWLDDDSDILEDPIERSLFIPGKTDDGSESPLTLALAISLGKKYNQDSVIYSGPDIEGKIEMWGVDKKDPEALKSQTFTKQMTFNRASVFSGKALEDSLNEQKKKLIYGVKGGIAGASQVGNAAKKVPLGSKDSVKIDTSKPGYRFDPVFEALGQEWSSVGVGYLFDTQPRGDGYPGTSGRINFLENDTLAGPEDWAKFKGCGTLHS